MGNVAALRKTLRKHGQEHLLRFWDKLPEARQDELAGQIQAIDFDRLDALIETHVRRTPQVVPADDIQPPPIVPGRPTNDAEANERAGARRRGERLLAEGKVAAFVVAGGQGTRLEYDGPKGCFPATPVKHKPLFQVFAEQILAASRRSGSPIPWYVMTSPANDAATRTFFRGRGHFGLPEGDVFFLTQGTMPAIGPDGKLLLAENGSLALSPNGHGGSLQALRDSGALADMARRGIEVISYFQVDNPLVKAVDPVFLGLHDLRAAQVGAKALPKRDPMERLGNFCLVDGKVTVIEYSDMPDHLARATTDDGHLRFCAGSIAIHTFSRTFVEALTGPGGPALPFHRADKKVPCIDEAGNRTDPTSPNAVKLEMFVFDAMPLADNTVILETVRSEEFSPIKNAEGDDSPATSLHDQVRRATQWLEDAGIEVPRDADGQPAAAIEISPLLADSPEAVADKVDPKLTIAPGENVYLE